MTLPPVLDAGGRALDQIRITGLEAFGYHGVFDYERRDGQQFRIDVVLHLNLRSAAETDDLVETVDYGHLAVRLAEIVRGDPVNLIETLAERLAMSCLVDSRVLAADVAVHKPQAPVTEVVLDVVVLVRRTRADVTESADEV
jgi:dihydroneopterin aldolase